MTAIPSGSSGPRVLLTPDVLHRVSILQTCPSTHCLMSGIFISICRSWACKNYNYSSRDVHSGAKFTEVALASGTAADSCASLRPVVNSARSSVTDNFPVLHVCELKCSVCPQHKPGDVAGSRRGSCWTAFGDTKICCARIISNFSPCTILLRNRPRPVEKIEVSIQITMRN